MKSYTTTSDRFQVRHVLTSDVAREVSRHPLTAKALLQQILTLTLGLPFLLLWEGYVLHTLWRWFVVPAFEAPQISTLSAAGILLTLRILFYPLVDWTGNLEDSFTWRYLARLLAWRTLSLAQTLGLGWLLYQLVRSQM